jgi:hypothetical protein
VDLGQGHFPSGIDEFTLGTKGEETTHDLPGGPRNCGDGGNTQALVHLGSLRVIDSSDDLLDSIRLASYSRRNNVRIVSAAHGSEGMCASNPSSLEGFSIKAHPAHRDSREIAPKAAESFGILINNGDRVAPLVKSTSEQGSNPAAAHDDDVHAATLHPWWAAPE